MEIKPNNAVTDDYAALIESESHSASKKNIDMDLLSKKCLLTLEEASYYTGLGQQKLRDLSNSENCKFVLWNGAKRMFKTEMLKQYLYSAYSI